MAGSSVSLALSVNRLMTLLNSNECSADALSTELARMSIDMEAGRFSALALIADTASNGCRNSKMPWADIQAATLELCERLLEAAKTDEPFSFQDAPPTLLGLLFPEPEPESAPEPEPAPSPQSLKGREGQVETVVLDGSKTTSSQTGNNQANHFGAVENCHETELVNSKLTHTVCDCKDEVLLQQFLVEAIEHVQNAQSRLLKLEQQPNDTENLDELFRSVHSIKGAAGVCEVSKLIEVAHIAESVLVRAREGQLRLAGPVFTVVLQAVDFLATQLSALDSANKNKNELLYPVAPEILIQCLTTIDHEGTCSSQQLHELRRLMSEQENSPEHSGESSSQNNGESQRVDGKKLEQLVDLIGELVITEGFVQRELNERSSKNALSVSSKLRKVVREVQQLSLALKMVPVGSLLQKMNRIVRDLSEKLNKPARVVIHGADTEVDKTLLEHLADPLVHLIRNSLDHGIESNVQDRTKAGKPEVATIEITAEHRSGCIHITISDDGRGLDRQRIRNRAIERGLISEGVRLSDHEVDNLIFLPGFSTAETVSEISGRGVGMDVVRKNVESLRGDIQLRSDPGHGTQIRLELPLTLSIIDGTIAKVGDRSFILPTVSVIEQIQLEKICISSTSTGELVHFRNHVIPFRPLGQIVGAEHQVDTHRGQVCMVVEAFGERHALLVDQILGQQSIVIKPLGAILKSFDLFAGCALLSSGDIAFVLDLNAVCRRISKRQTMPQLQEI